jgi:hypothetical protein
MTDRPQPSGEGDAAIRSKGSSRRTFWAFAGASFGIIVAAIASGSLLLWYLNRPAPQDPWRDNAIRATFDYADVEGADNKIVFTYVLENSTARDFEITSSSSLRLMARLKRQNSLSAGTGDALTLDLPVFVPAGRRQSVRLHLAYEFSGEVPPAGTQEERTARRRIIAGYVAEKFENLDGFSVFDQDSRYEIQLPRGW